MADMGRDMKQFPLCCPWWGEEGPKYTRRFKPDLISALGGERDKFNNLRQHAIGQDVGGTDAGWPDRHHGDQAEAEEEEAADALLPGRRHSVPGPVLHPQSFGRRNPAVHGPVLR